MVLLTRTPRLTVAALMRELAVASVHELLGQVCVRIYKYIIIGDVYVRVRAICMCVRYMYRTHTYMYAVRMCAYHAMHGRVHQY